MRKTAQTEDRASRQKGFTLVEVTISMLILTFGLLALGPLSAMVVRTNQVSGRKSVAVVLCQERMEEYRRAGYNGIPATGTSVTDYVAINTATNQMTVSSSNPGGLSYRRVTQVATVGSPAASHLKKVQVNVFWAGSLSVQLDTIVAQ